MKVIQNSASAVDFLSGEKSNSLRQRLPKDDEEKAFEYVKTDVRSCGLLVSDLSKSGAFKFAHKSFMEYLFASLVHNRLTKDHLPEKEVEITESILKAFNSLIGDILQYPESVSFMAELLKSAICKSAPCLDEKNILAKNIFELLIFRNLKTNNIFFKTLWRAFVVDIYVLSQILSSSRTLQIDYYSFTNRVIDKLLFKRETRGDIFDVWYQCCQALNIEDREEIAKVLGKWAMPAFESTTDDEDKRIKH
ncbi:MAG: hypothetical protein VSS75_018840 [Candidatus Parabeggiatoa sp.]|nr:hypothetical protein [Candidatus Parabeggiatoa sp.]